MLAGGFGHMIGSLIRGETETAPDISSADRAGPTSDDRFPDWTSAKFSSVRPTNRAEFDTCVESLIESGVKKEFAQWIALSAFVRSDLRASWEVAREGKLLDMWSALAAETDPRGGLELLRDAPSSDATMFAWLSRSEGAMPSFFAALGRKDPTLALELAIDLPPSSRWLNFYALFQSWAAQDPIEALTQAQALNSKLDQRTALRAALKAWSDTDLPGMIEWAEQPHDRGILKTAFQSLWEIKGMRSPASVLALIERHPEIDAGFAPSEIATALAQSGAEGWKVIAQVKSGPLRDNLIRNFGSRFSQRDPAAAWELAQSLPPSDRNIFLRHGLSHLAEHFPAEIAQSLAGEGRIDSDAAQSLLRGWRQKDPARALAWAQENGHGNLLVKESGDLLAALYEKDPAQALAAWATLPPGLRVRSLPDLAHKWGAAHPQEALAWTADLPPNERSRALDNVFEGWARQAPQAAAEGILSRPGEKLTSAVKTIADGLAQESIPKAESWIAKLPEAQAAPATEALFQKWAALDSAAAADRLDTLPPGILRDRSIVGFSWSASPYDPESAAAWAASIEDAALRNRAFRNLAYNWRDKDRSAARAFFAKSISDPAVRKNILKIVNERN